MDDLFDEVNKLVETLFIQGIVFIIMVNATDHSLSFKRRQGPEGDYTYCTVNFMNILKKMLQNI